MLAMLLTVCSLALPAAFPQTEAAPTTFEVTGTHFRVVSDFEDNELGRRLAQEALDLVELTWPQAEKLFQVPEQSEKLLTVNLFREYESYVAADQEQTGGMFKTNWGFSSYSSGASYVALQPPSTDATLERVGLPFQTKRMLAHEATHLVMYASFANHQAHPGWLAEGLTGYVGQVVMLQESGFKRLSDIPYFGDQAGNLQALLEAGNLPTLDQALGGDLGKLNSRDRYALWASVFSFFAEKQKPKFKKVMASAFQLGGGSTYQDRLHEAVVGHFGKGGYKKLEKSFAKYVQSPEPLWTEIYYSLGSPELVQIAFPTSNAIAWRRNAPKRSQNRLAGTIEFLQGNQMNILLDRSDAGFVSISLVAGENPSVTVFDYGAAKNNWDNVGFVRLESLPMHKATEFQVDFGPELLTLSLDGSRVCELAIAGHDFSGPWGLGAQRGSGGIWELTQIPKE